MESDEYRKLYELEESFWWFLGMRDISTALLDRFQTKGSAIRILDAGCGTGGMLLALRDWGSPFGLDQSSEAINLARSRGFRRLVRGDVSSLPFSSASFDLVTSFDVLYHERVENDENALREMARVLRPGGMLLIRVPAMNWIRGSHDVAVHTRHRYGKQELEDKLSRAGFVVQFATFVNFALLPVAILHRGTERLRKRRTGSDVEPVSNWLNRFLYLVLRAEARWIRFARLPLGLSLVGVARRQPV